jgi:hypothetical protein
MGLSQGALFYLLTKLIIMSSFHGTTIKTTVSNLIRVIGEPDEATNDGRDKTNFDWYNLTLGGHKVTIYDWKEYRRISEDETIEFHIGGNSELETIDAKIELQKLLNK